MDENQKVEILREQIAALRSEVVRYSDSQRTIARYSIIGVAAIAVLRKDLSIGDFETFLPIVPIIGMGMIAVMVLENVFIFRSGRWLAAAEKQLNEIAGEPFLVYEQSIRNWRTKWLSYGRVPTISFLVAATIAYFWCFFYLLTFSDLSLHPGIVLVLIIFAVIAYLFAGIYFVRMAGELRAGIPDLAVLAYTAPESPLGTAGLPQLPTEASTGPASTDARQQPRDAAKAARPRGEHRR